MKKQLLFAVATVLLFSTFLFASSPGNDYSKDLAKKLVNSLSIYVDLTDSQKVALQIKADNYELKFKNLQNEPDVDKRARLINQSLVEYRNYVDSLLSQAQKDTFKIREFRHVKSEIQKIKDKK